MKLSLFKRIAIILCLFAASLIIKNDGVFAKARDRTGDPEERAVKHEIVPFETEGEPGLMPGYDPSKIEPIPTPQADPEMGGRLSKPLVLTPEKSIKEPTIFGVQPGPPAPSPFQRTGALAGKFVYVNPGHGWYKSGGTWKTQRVNYNDIVEDHGNADQVCFFMIQYLRCAGATVIPLRDIGPQTEMHIIDNDDPGFTLSGTWNESTGSPFWGDDGDAVHYVFATSEGEETAVARWTPNFTRAGYYPVFVWYLDAGNRCTKAKYRIVHKGGISQIALDQTRVGKGWIWLGNYYFDTGTSGYLELINQSADTDKDVVSDAARFGSGVHEASGYPLYEMDGYEYNVFSQAPGSVTGVSDVWNRPRMAAYMNNADLDDVCYVSFHSNGFNGSARGAVTLKNTTSYEGGTAPRAQEFASTIIAQLDGDLYNLWQLPSRNNQIITSSYGELTYNNLNGEMTATIVEVAFHDNVEDAELLNTPGFRQDAARAVLQGIVDYFADFGNPINTYLPDAPGKLSALITGAGRATISWEAPPSGGYGADAATGYIVYKSTDGLAWDNGVDVGDVTSYEYPGLTADQDYYFRVSGHNAGGESFPSETVGARITADGEKPEVLVVLGYDRYHRDNDPSYYDPQNGWSRRVWPWLNNGFGYVVPHGKAITESGYYFETTCNEKIIDGSVSLSDYITVDWIRGREKEEEETFSTAEQGLVATFLENGGRLFVSGSEIGYDLEIYENATPGDTAFLHGALQVQCTNDNGSETNMAIGMTGSIFAGVAGINFQKEYESGYYDIEKPDAFAGLGAGSRNALTYTDTSKAAAIEYEDSIKKLVVMGFPFEMIHGSEKRSLVMERILDFLVDIVEPTPTPTPTPGPQDIIEYLLARGGLAIDANDDGKVDISDVVSYHVDEK